MKKPKQFVFFVIGLSLFANTNSIASVLVISNPKNELKLSKDEIKNIFLGKKKTFPDGNAAKPVDQTEDLPVRQEFYLKLADKTPAEIKAYWSDLIFSGYGSPPKSVGDNGAVKKFVQENENAVGYIDSKFLDSTVKTVLDLK
jgi:ABC-type phosphate transport system substrate-binding protein